MPDFLIFAFLISDSSVIFNFVSSVLVFSSVPGRHHRAPGHTKNRFFFPVILLRFTCQSADMYVGMMYACIHPSFAGSLGF